MRERVQFPDEKEEKMHIEYGFFMPSCKGRCIRTWGERERERDGAEVDDANSSHECRLCTRRQCDAQVIAASIRKCCFHTTLNNAKCCCHRVHEA